MKSVLAALLLMGFWFQVGEVHGGGLESTSRAYNTLGFQLLAQCRQSLPKANYFLSPAGLAFALSMVQNGAQGETLAQLMATLQVSNLPAAKLNEDNKELLYHLLKLDSKITLEIANSIWIDRKARIKPDFISINQSDYNAQVATGNFQDPATVKDINKWVSESTHGKIQSILQPPLDPLLRMILLDAIYFKGAWVSPFDTNTTRDLPFTLANGQIVTHPLMTCPGAFNYFAGDGFQAVELPYMGGQVSMMVFLPSASLDDFLKKFTLADFEAALGHLEHRKGTVDLPRFKLENEYGLKNVLMAMGMPLAFSEKADFRGLSDEPLHIGDVKQKTYLEVNEQGTEAAAVTAIRIEAMAMRREPPPFHLTVDRPFFVAIRERETGLILFLGAISDPRGKL
jgi:serpin B